MVPHTKYFEQIFVQNYKCSSIPQKEKGSFHFQNEKEKYIELLKDGYQTPVQKIIEYSKMHYK